MIINFFTKKKAVKIGIALVGIVLLGILVKNLPHILVLTFSLDNFRDYIVSLGHAGAATLVMFQMLQTIVAPIPGEVIQAAGGYIYGVTIGMFYVSLGMILGGMVAFYFARFLGAGFIRKMLEKKKFRWIYDIMESKRFTLIIFLVFLVPGLPKDFLIYVAGLTNIKASRFFMILFAGRFPWLLASVSVGANLHSGNYRATVVIALIAVTAFALGLVYKDKLLDRFVSGQSLQIKNNLVNQE